MYVTITPPRVSEFDQRVPGSLVALPQEQANMELATLIDTAIQVSKSNDRGLLSVEGAYSELVRACLNSRRVMKEHDARARKSARIVPTIDADKLSCNIEYRWSFGEVRVIPTGIEVFFDSNAWDNLMYELNELSVATGIEVDRPTLESVRDKFAEVE